MAVPLRALFWISGLWFIVGFDDVYKAAFVEHEVVSPCGSQSCGKLQKAASVKRYRIYAAEAAAQGAQIIVFPEYGITGESSQPKSAWVRGDYTEAIPDLLGKNPCNSAFVFPDASTVVSLSCIAKKHNIAIVANLIDHNGGKLYNTDVAFDTDGRLIAKYYKQNLWGERNIDVPEQCSQAVFNTSFGVTFGMFTCADLIYQHPAIDMVKKGVRHFVVPVAWTNEMAQLQTMAYAQGWSARHGVNLIVSNLRQGDGSGSGIWSSGRTLASQYTPGAPSGQVIVAELPIYPPQLLNMESTRPSLFTPTRKSHWSLFGSVLSLASRTWHRLILDGRSEKKNQWKFVDVKIGHVCSGSICCKAKVTAGDGAGYALGALDGLDSEEGVDPFPAEVCAILPCRDPAGSCLMYQSPQGRGSLFGAELHMSGLDSTNIIPEVFATNRKGTRQILLEHGRTTNGFQFWQSGSEASLVVSSEQRLGSAILYGRQFSKDHLPYTCQNPGPPSLGLGPSPPPPEACHVCPKCHGDYNCDEWIEWDPTQYSCPELERDWGCNCSGCRC